jgi:hypothetical protein
MTTQQQLDERIGKWLEAEAPGRMPDHLLTTTFERTRTARQSGAWRALPGGIGMDRWRFPLARAALVLLVTSVTLSVWAGLSGDAGLPPLPSATSAPPSAEPTMGSTPTFVVGRPEDGTPLGWSRDGTRHLIQRGGENLFILHADGSQTQVTEELTGFNDIPGSSRPSGATISPDGTRVVFAGLTKAPEGRYCHFGALFTVDANGGPAEVLWESQAATDGGIVRYPMFSPDGTQIAFVDGYCDHGHSVWVMNADGSDPQQIVSMDEAGHVHGLAWSTAGDRIALRFAGASGAIGAYSFEADGSDFTSAYTGSRFCWPGQQC